MEFQVVPPVRMGFEEFDERRDDVLLPSASRNTIQIIGIPRAVANQLQAGPFRSPTRETLHIEGSKAFQRIPFPGTQDKQRPAGAIVFPPRLCPFPGQKDCVAGTRRQEAVPLVGELLDVFPAFVEQCFHADPST